MKRLIRFFTVLIAWLALLTHIKIPDGILLIPLTILKILAGSTSPFLGTFSILAALFGILFRDKLTFFAGLTGAYLASKQISKATAPHHEFEFSFGPDWQQRIPYHIQWRLRPRRYTLEPLKPQSIQMVKDFVIGLHQETGDPLLADIWQPQENVARTGLGIIHLHSGGWHFSDKHYLARTPPLFQHLANQGHFIVDVSYTVAPKATLIPMVADVKRAIVWMKENAESLQINPKRIILMGGSAGAHLALLAAYTPSHPILDPADVVPADTAVHGVISCCGFSDMVTGQERLSRFQHIPTFLVPWLESIFKSIGYIPQYGRYVEIDEMIPNLLGGLPDEEPDMYQLGSPITHVGPHCPPTLLLNGTHDAGPDSDQHRQLHAALYQHKVTCVHVEFDCTDHIFDLVVPRWSPAGQAALYDVERFLALLI